jgi:hypothetical protein
MIKERESALFDGGRCWKFYALLGLFSLYENFITYAGK